MGKTESKHETGEKFQEMKRLIEEKGVRAAQNILRGELEGWRDVVIKIGVTGDSGVGKSSFVNRFRGIDNDEDKGAAKTGVVETTSKPASYLYPDNPKITLMDLPGIGTPTYSDLETYCEKVRLETYDTFLILTATRFKQHELELAQKIKSMGKSFFLVRTKIDVDETNEERKKKPNIADMLRRIRAYCHGSVKDLGIREDEIFLISNQEKNKWDFDRLVQAILEKLSTHQKKALILSLKIVSKNIVKRKLEVYKSRLNVIGSFNAIMRIFLLPTFSFYTKAEVEEKTEFYRSQLGLPEKDSVEFKMMKPELQERMKRFYPKKGNSYMERILKYFNDEKGYDIDNILSSSDVEDLPNLLEEMEQLSLDILDDAATRAREDMD